MSKTDIKDRSDVITLVTEFYKIVKEDAEIGYFFTDIAKVDWDKHLPVMFDFWESVLFEKALYKGNPMIPHLKLNRMEKLEDKHFNRWFEIWTQTIKRFFEGKKADEALRKAQTILSIMKHKVGLKEGF